MQYLLCCGGNAIRIQMQAVLQLTDRSVLNNAAAEIQQPGAAHRNAVCRGVCKKKRTKTSGAAGFLRHNKPSGFPQ